MRTLAGLIFLVITSCNYKTETSEERVKKLGSDSIPAKVMRDEKLWMTKNLNITIKNSFCPEDTTLCSEYGRLYTWKAAMEGCRALGDGWRLPTNEEWQSMAWQYGGIVNDSDDEGKSAYLNLSEGGSAGFNALLAGNRQPNGEYQRLGAHGFYWTSTESDSTEAWFYNFAKEATLLNHHTGSKERAISVRCIREHK